MANTTTNNAKVANKNLDEQKILELKKENAEIKEKLEKLMKMFESTEAKTEESNKVEVEKSVPNEVPEEPSPNKIIRVVSLCRGCLSLSEDDSGRGKVKFAKYGEIKTVLYSSLINIVNNNRGFAEKGLFYILDKSAVYYLGLKDIYSKLVTKEMLDNVCKYEDVDISKMIEDSEPVQIETMARNLADRIYGGESLDLNKIEFISKKSGINIMGIVNEMRNYHRS